MRRPALALVLVASIVFAAGSLAAESYRYWVPIGGHAAGGQSSQWRTDLSVLNQSNESASVTVTFYAAGGPYPLPLTLGPGAQTILPDFVARFGIEAFGPFEVRSDKPLAVGSRTYTQAADGSTLGQTLDGVTVADGLGAGEVAMLGQLTENAAFRSNIGLFNASDGYATVVVDLFNGETAENVGSFTTRIPPGNVQQTSQVFQKVAHLGNVNSGYARVTVTEGRGVIAYGSVLDNTTNDPTTIPMKRLLAVAVLPTQSWIPIAARGEGKDRSQWRTDLSLLNGSVLTATVQILLHAPGGTLRLDRQILAGRQLLMRDVLGAFPWDGFAPIEVQADRPLCVTSRTYTQRPDLSTFGQDLGGFITPQGLATGGVGFIGQLVESPRYRSNLGVANCGTTTTAANVELFNGTTGAKVAAFPVNVAPGTVQQFSQPFVSQAHLTDVPSGYAKVTVTSGSGLVVYGSVLDNTTNDPSTVAMRRYVAMGSEPLTSKEVVDTLMTTVSRLGASTVPLPTLVSTIATLGPASVGDLLVSTYPTVVTKRPNGVHADYHGGFIGLDGSLYEGVIDATWSDTTQDPMSISGTMVITLVGVKRDGRPVADVTITAVVTGNLRADGSAYAQITYESTLLNNPAVTTSKGTIKFDTRTCNASPSWLDIYFKQLQKVFSFKLAGCGQTTQTETTPPVIPPYPAQSARLAISAIEGCGDPVWMSDWAMTIASGGAVSVTRYTPVANSTLTGSGTVVPNPNWLSNSDPNYLWNVPFTYTYQGAPSNYTITGNFKGTSIDGTMTAGSCTVAFKGLRVTWH